MVVCHLLGEEKGRRRGGGVAVWFRFVLCNVFQYVLISLELHPCDNLVYESEKRRCMEGFHFLY